MPLPSVHSRAWPVLLGCVVVWLAGCKNECPPLSIQEGDFCRWTHDAGVAGGSSQGGNGARAGRGSAGKGGAAAGSNIDPSAWTCEQADSACNCVQGEGNGKDTCETPKPGCCYVYPEGGKDHCSCVPLDSPACSELFMRADAGVAANCPL